MNFNDKQTLSTGTIWEKKYSYSRAKKAGPFIEVAGTTSSDENGVQHIGDASSQAKFIFEKISKALQDLGSGLSDVMRTRMYITDAAFGNDVASVHGEFMKGINPASTIVVVDSLLTQEMLVEIEVSAIVTR